MTSQKAAAKETNELLIVLHREKLLFGGCTYGINNMSFTFFFSCSYLRSVAYREFSRLVYGFLGNKRTPLTACAYTAIRKASPAGTDESFTGFGLDEDNN